MSLERSGLNVGHVVDRVADRAIDHADRRVSNVGEWRKGSVSDRDFLASNVCCCQGSARLTFTAESERPIR
jgi:hypothetical protein